MIYTGSMQLNYLDSLYNNCIDIIISYCLDFTCLINNYLRKIHLHFQKFLINYKDLFSTLSLKYVGANDSLTILIFESFASVRFAIMYTILLRIKMNFI